MRQPKNNTTVRIRKNFRFPADLVKWVENYAASKNTSMTQLIVDHFTALRDSHLRK
jgi:hypothetical protein